MTDAAPLHATVTRRDGRYVVEVSGVEIGVADDVVGATTRLCTEAAKYRRRVFVAVGTRHGYQHLEIDESGTIAKTTAPAGTATPAPAVSAAAAGKAPAAPALATRPADSVLVGTRAAHPDPSASVHAAAAADGGYPAATAVSAARESRRWWLRSRTPALIRAGLVLLVVSAGAAVTEVNLDAAAADRAAHAAWTGVPAAGSAEVRRLRAAYAGDPVAELRRHARDHQLQIQNLAATPDPSPGETPHGPVESAGLQVTVSATGADVAGWLGALAEGGGWRVVAARTAPNGVVLTLHHATPTS